MAHHGQCSNYLKEKNHYILKQTKHELRREIKEKTFGCHYVEFTRGGHQVKWLPNAFGPKKTIA
jgi:hypothetical protein